MLKNTRRKKTKKKINQEMSKDNHNSNWHKGPSDKSYYIRSSTDYVGKSNPSNTIDSKQQVEDHEEDEEQELGEEGNINWEDDPFFLQPMQLRSAPNMKLIDWAQMGMWRKNLFGFLLALSIRLPKDVKMTSHIGTQSGKNGVTYSRIQWCYSNGNRTVTVVGQGESKTKARQDSAQKLIDASKLYQWLIANHSNTYCADHLA